MFVVNGALYWNDNRTGLGLETTSRRSAPLSAIDQRILDIITPEFCAGTTNDEGGFQPPSSSLNLDIPHSNTATIDATNKPPSLFPQYTSKTATNLETMRPPRSKRIRGPLSEIQTAVGLDAALPCDLLPSSNVMSIDKVQLLIWYKEGTEQPIYTFDSRGKTLQQATHWADQNVLKTKAHFYYDSNPPALKIKNIQRDDAGLYRCRVDFQKSPTRNSRINLTVLIPPTKLTILDDQGAAILDHVLGPYNEGASINVTCISSGGIPPPRVSWWREHALLDDSNQILPDGSVKNILHLSKINRRDLHTVYTCQASNGHVVPPLSNAVKLEMRLPPLYVKLQGLNHPVVAGLRTQLSCNTAGARPSPQILWSKGGVSLRGATQTTSPDGNVTTSELVFLPAPEDNGKLVTCSVSTASSTGGGVELYLKDSRVLDIKHAPIVSLSLGAALDPSHLMKGSDVYLECEVKSNPPIKKVEWYHNDKQLYSSRGIIISNQTLVLQGITKQTHGQYMCRATNPQGTVNSNEIYLDVKYPPVCKQDSQIIRAAIKQTVNITCDVDSNPKVNLNYKWYFNNTVENISELPSIQMITMSGSSTNSLSDDANLLNDVNYQQNNIKNYNVINNKSIIKSGVSVSSKSRFEQVPKDQGNVVYPYKIESFTHFGTVTCTAKNAIGQSGPCLYHILAADLPDPVKNCTAFNETSSSVHMVCVPGKDGGITQQFHAEVVDVMNRMILYNISFKSPSFILKRLPSDTDIVVKVTSYNAQGSSASNSRVRFKTLPAPLLRTASSTAVLVQLTPLLGALMGVVVTLLVIGLCIVTFIKLRKPRRDPRITQDTNQTDAHNKGSSEPLQRDMGDSHSSLDEKNPDVIPQENSEDEEKAFDRLKFDTQRIIYTPAVSVSPPPQIQSSLHSPTNGFNQKSYAALSLTTNPGYLHNTLPTMRPHVYSSPLMLRSPSNIYSRVPSSQHQPLSPQSQTMNRNFIPYNHQQHQHNTNSLQSQLLITTPSATTICNNGSSYGVTIPLLPKSNGFNSILTNDLDENS